MAFRYFPNSQGSGIPQAIAARHFHDAESRNFLLSLKLAAAKIVLTIFGIFCGGSIGREGPTVQVGASIMLQAARIGGVVQARGLIRPVPPQASPPPSTRRSPGIVFAIEEMSRNFEIRANGAVLTAVILSGLAALGLLGDYNTYFGSTHDVMNGMKDWWLVSALRHWRRRLRGAVLDRSAQADDPAQALASGRTGPAAYCDCRRLRLSRRAHRHCLRRAHLRHRLQSGPRRPSGNPAAALFFVEKLAATFLCTMSGIPGGLFAPSLAVGAGIGSTIGLIMGTNAGIAPFSAWRDTLRASSRPHDRLCHHSRNDRQPPERHRAYGHRHARLHHLPPHQPRPLYHGLSRAFMADTIRHQRNQERARGTATEKQAHA